MRQLQHEILPKTGIVIRMSDPDPDPGLPRYLAAYTAKGEYVGAAATGREFERMGIMPELAPPEDDPDAPEGSNSPNCCSIGFCEAEQAWYGWSHRAIFSFEVGTTVSKEDVGYTPNTPQELFDKVTAVDEDGYQWMDPDDVVVLEDGTRLRFAMVRPTAENPDGTLVGWVDAGYRYRTMRCGRGEWTAETLEDAKQMAIDFARVVS